MTSKHPTDEEAAPKPFGAYAPGPWRRAIISFTRSMPESYLGRRAAFAVRRLAFVPPTRPLDIDIDGVRFRLTRRGNLCEKRLMFTPQYFDAEELAIVRQHIADQNTRPYIFLDIGSNIGAYALFIASWAGPSARVYAFEPQPHIHQRLRTNLSFNDLPGVAPQSIALADKTGEMTLHIDSTNSGESSLKKLDGRATTSSVTVPTMTLLDFARQESLPYISAMKLDVEGAEDLILSPFFADAPAELLPDLMIVENADVRWSRDIVSEAQSRGYRIDRKTRMNLVLRR